MSGPAPIEVSSPAVPSAPLVSVLLVTYNHERYIAQAIEGVVRQETAFPFELIVGEDCSTDGTRAIVLEWQKRFPDRIRVLLQRANKGGAGNVRDVFARSRGTYVAELEGDDYWTDPQKLQLQVDALAANPGAVLCGARAYVWTEGTEAPSEIQPPDASEVIAQFDARDMVRGRWWFRTCTKMYRRDIRAELPSNLQGDWPSTLWAIARTQFAPICFVDRIVGVYRVHQGGTWSRLAEYEKNAADVRSLVGVMSWFEGADRAYLASELDSRIACLATRATPLAVRLGAAWAVLRTNPLSPRHWRTVSPLWFPTA